MLLKKIIKPLKITYLIFVGLLTIAMLFVVPSFSASSKDILIDRLSTFCFFAISFVLPAVFILSQSIRKKIPLFNKKKLISTILGCSLLFVIGMIVYIGIDSFHSVEYSVAKSKYDAVIEAKKVEANKIKAEVKAQAKAEEEAKDKEEADAKARAKAEAKAKDKEEADAKAQAKAKEEAKDKEEADAKATADPEAKVKSKEEVADKAEADAKAIENAKIAEAKAKEDARIAEEARIAAEKVKAEQAKKAEAKRLLNTEAGFKAVCVDIPWAELVKDRTTYKGTYLKKDLMVRQIATIDDETVYLCGENKGGGVYVGGEFVVFDKRSNKSKSIELYDKIYIHGQVSGLWYSGGMNYRIEPHVDAKYVEFRGKFGQ